MSTIKNRLIFLTLLAIVGGGAYASIKMDGESGELRALSAEDARSLPDVAIPSQPVAPDTGSESLVDPEMSPLLRLDWQKVSIGDGTDRKTEYRNGDFLIRNDSLYAVFPHIEEALDTMNSLGLSRHSIESMHIDSNTITSRTIRDGDIRSRDLHDTLTIKNLSIAGTLTLADDSLLSLSPDSLDFTDLKDVLALDASTDIESTDSNVLSFTNSGTSSSFVVNDAAGDTSPFLIDSDGNVAIGSVTPNRKLEILESNSVPQLRLSKSSAVYADMMADSAGDLSFVTTGGDIRALDENLWVCAGAGCPAVTPTGQGNVVVENAQIFGNNFSTKQIDETALGTYDSAGDLIMIFDEGL